MLLTGQTCRHFRNTDNAAVVSRDMKALGCVLIHETEQYTHLIFRTQCLQRIEVLKIPFTQKRTVGGFMRRCGALIDKALAIIKCRQLSCAQPGRAVA